MNLVTSSLQQFTVDILPQENHPELPVIKLEQDEVNAAWEDLCNLALQRRETLSSAADLQRFKRYKYDHLEIASYLLVLASVLVIYLIAYQQKYLTFTI